MVHILINLLINFTTVFFKMKKGFKLKNLICQKFVKLFEQINIIENPHNHTVIGNFIGRKNSSSVLLKLTQKPLPSKQRDKMSNSLFLVMIIKHICTQNCYNSTEKRLYRVKRNGHCFFRCIACISLIVNNNM